MLLSLMCIGTEFNELGAAVNMAMSPSCTVYVIHI